MQILIPLITIACCAVFLYWFFGGFDHKGRECLRRANRRNARSLELLKERGRAWDAFESERARDRKSPLLPRLKRAYHQARRRYEDFPIDWNPATS